MVAPSFRPEKRMPINFVPGLGSNPLQTILWARHQWRMAMGIEVTAVDSSDRVGWDAAAVRIGEVSMSSVATMTDNVLAARGSYRIRKLNILDHGTSDSFQIGEDWIDQGTLPMYATTLGRLTPAFHADGLVHLQACWIGINKALLVALAKIWKVPVYAGTGLHNPVLRFNWGQYVRVDPDGGSCPTGRPGVGMDCV